MKRILASATSAAAVLAFATGASAAWTVAPTPQTETPAPIVVAQNVGGETGTGGTADISGGVSTGATSTGTGAVGGEAGTGATADISPGADISPPTRTDHADGAATPPTADSDGRQALGADAESDVSMEHYGDGSYEGDLKIAPTPDSTAAEPEGSLAPTDEDGAER